MTYRPDINQLNVDATSLNGYYTNSPDSPFTVKNIGLVTCYAGVVRSADPVVNIPNGYPILPGETVIFPASDGVVENMVGFNTIAGTTKIAIIGVVNE